jgi:Protein of unknown function (DUF664)
MLRRESASTDILQSTTRDRSGAVARSVRSMPILVRLARAVTVGGALDDTFVHPQRGMAINLRWVYVHMIEEYGWSNGHADLLRERIDGVTGARSGEG